MDLPLDLGAVELFLVFVVPGLISMSVYRLLMPARSLQWDQAVLQGLFYSSVNLLLTLPITAHITQPGYLASHPRRSWALLLGSLFVAPMLWPLLLRGLFRWSWFARKIQIPYPTAWDYVFDARESAFVLVHLRNGSLIGGYWGPGSYAGSFPNDGDVYLEAVYQVDEHGRFGDPVDDTRGVLLRKDEYSYLELFAIPNQENGHAQEQTASSAEA